MTLLTERRGPALWLRLDRPQALNGLTPELLDELDAGLDKAEADTEIRCVVLAATGRVFCSGADLKYVRSLLADADTSVERQLGLLHRVGRTVNRIEVFGKPVLAAVQGKALAGGLELVLAADVVIAGRSAAFGDAHANYGLLPGAGASTRLPARVGRSLAKYLMFTGDPVPAADLTHTDLVTVLVEDDQLEDEVGRIAARIAAKSPLGLARMKALAGDASDVPISVALRRELEVSELHLHSYDFREGLAAFNAKRTPQFIGR
ncbi:MAG TPA: enoyl-CoA hydratase/isomerase family protein [Pseudonocardia sp.]